MTTGLQNRTLTSFGSPRLTRSILTALVCPAGEEGHFASDLQPPQRRTQWWHHGDLSSLGHVVFGGCLAGKAPGDPERPHDPMVTKLCNLADQDDFRTVDLTQ